MWLSRWLPYAKKPRISPELLQFELRWRRRADSNRRIEVLQTSALDHLATSPNTILLKWCRGGDSNSYSLYGHSALNAACLPIPPPRQYSSHIFQPTSVAKYYIYSESDCLQTKGRFPMAAHVSWITGSTDTYTKIVCIRQIPPEISR